MFRAIASVLCIFALSGCSYSYDVKAKLSEGRLVFNANPQWGADCVRQVEVASQEDGAGTVWQQSIAHDDGCENTFPIVYGAALDGKPHIYGSGGVPAELVGTTAPSVPAKKLKAGVVYIVSTTTGATGYGCGRFRIGPNRHVENLGCP